MFTGIVQSVGKVAALESQGDDARLLVQAQGMDLVGVRKGDSMAVSGVCLTVTDTTDRSFSADVSGETISRTVLGELAVDSAVNLEKALTPTTPLGGHLVSGHVDGIGEVLHRHKEGRSVRFRIRAPTALARYIAEKGSICVDGISLTVNAVEGAVFDVNIVPHTLQATTMGEFTVGRRVNLEADIIARYLERLLLRVDAADPQTKSAK